MMHTRYVYSEEHAEAQLPSTSARYRQSIKKLPETLER